MDALNSCDILLFDPFRFDRGGRLLFQRAGNGRYLPVSIGARALAVLEVLTERPGDLVSKDEIMRIAWPGVTVEEGNLTVQISTLRRILDAGSEGESCIQTVSGRGYRFLPAVRIANDQLPAPRRHRATVELAHMDRALPRAQPPSKLPTPRGHRIKESIAGAFPLTALLAPGGWGTPHPSASPTRSTTTKPIRASDRRQSIMIMPFGNSDTDDRENDLAADITREVTNHISKGAEGPVMAGVAGQGYLGNLVDPRVIGCEHDVHVVLTGNARRQEERLIVTAVLYETAGGGPVWARELDVPDGPDALPNLAQVIYESTWQRSVDLEAWHAVHDRPDHLDKRDLILIALSTPLWNPTQANYLKKLSLVDHALRLDPSYLRGWERRARLLVEYVLLGYSTDPVADLAMATEAADSALAIDAHVQLSLRVKAAVLRARGEWPEAEAVQRRVLTLKPTESFRHYELGMILMAQGRHEEALASLQTARQSAAGNNPIYWYDGEIAAAYLALGRFVEAIATARLAIGEMPPDLGRSEELPWLALIAASSLGGNDGIAKARLQKFLVKPRSWHSLAEVERWPAFAANPKLLDGLRRAGIPQSSYFGVGRRQ